VAAATRNKQWIVGRPPSRLQQRVVDRGVGVRAKVFQWVRRYGVAECAGVTCALTASFIIRRATRSEIAAAYAGAWGESIGYSTVIVGRDFLVGARAAHAARQRFGVRRAGGVVAGLIAEFGPSGLLDTFLIRPFTMGVGARLFGPQLGLIAGKLAADVIFYVPVIFIYERKKHWGKPGAP
jgi:hypothetical protein